MLPRARIVNFKGKPAALRKSHDGQIQDRMDFLNFKGKPAALTEYVRESVPELQSWNSINAWVPISWVLIRPNLANLTDK